VDGFVCRDLIELVDLRARENSSAVYVRLLSKSGDVQDLLTFADLKRRSELLATVLVANNLSGQRVIISLPQGIDFLIALFACFYAGVVAVPVHMSKHRRDRGKIEAIAQDCGAAQTLDAAFLLQHADKLAPGELLESGVRFTGDGDAGRADHTAFLQYTSGSTGRPKGVIVTHRNLLHNQRVIESSFGHSKSTIFASWLPLFHDMGLIGNLFQPLYLGIECNLISPLMFLEDPGLLMRIISKYKVTTCGMPNFGYEHCVKRIRPADMEGVRLDTWDIAYNGSEPINPRTIDEFSDRFSPYGFNPKSFYPCYGLAESTLLVTGSRKAWPSQRIAVSKEGLSQGSVDANAADPAILVSSGIVNPFLEVSIVNPATSTECSVDEVGEIWVRGESVAKGYWMKPQESAETFQAFDVNGRGPFLRTGDLGFIDSGNLYVTGRLKDLIIIRGSNYYPQDIEFSISKSSEHLGFLGSAAVSCDLGGVETLMVVQEISREHLRSFDRDEATKHIRHVVASEYGLNVHDVVYVPPLGIPRTSSGKLQRQKCKALFKPSEGANHRAIEQESLLNNGCST
jgi:acyl-CoA synthetase (AMP-forming)/AMP-acid ligase II